jgi:two-component system response regulator ChvI
MAGQASLPGAVSNLSVADRQCTDRPTLRIILVEHDKQYAVTLIAKLTEGGFSVRHFADGSSLLAALDQTLHAHVIVLAWLLPKMSGTHLLETIRRRGVKLPVVFLTGTSSIQDEIDALEGGATDFIAKSRGVEILVRRLRNVANLVTEAGADGMAPGRLTLRHHVSRALWDGVDVGLSLGEYKIAELLALNAGDYVPYRAIYDALRGPGFVSGCGVEGYRVNIRSAIKRLRNKFRAVDPNFSAIESYMSFGYRWRADGD